MDLAREGVSDAEPSVEGIYVGVRSLWSPSLGLSSSFTEPLDGGRDVKAASLIASGE